MKLCVKTVYSNTTKPTTKLTIDVAQKEEDLNPVVKNVVNMLLDKDLVGVYVYKEEEGHCF